VNSSGTFRWSIAIILLLSVAWKIGVTPEDPSNLKVALVGFFEGNGFNVVETDRIVNYTPIFEATKVTCRLQIARLTPDGSDWSLIEDFAKGSDRFFIVFRGTVYSKQPVLLTVVNYLWLKFLRELGFIRHITPVIAVAANSLCDLEGLPWREFGAS
jgi:hypothetical protein